MKSYLAVCAAVLMSVVALHPAQAETDPFPGVDYQAEIPGTRISSPPGYTQSQWEATDSYLSFSCPAHSGRAVSVDVSNKIRSNYCIKQWRPQAVIDAWQSYYDSLASAQELAYQRSLAWNTANPGQQKCFQWGPITDPAGGESSGGVCANPVAAGSESSFTVGREDPGVFEDSATVSRVASFLSSLKSLPVTTTKKKLSLPKLKRAKKLGLRLRSSSLTPAICEVSESKIMLRAAGPCKIRLAVRDQAGSKLVSRLELISLGSNN